MTSNPPFRSSSAVCTGLEFNLSGFSTSDLEDQYRKMSNGHVHALNKIWTKEDAAQYGDLMPVPCRRGGVRVTMPEILHGSIHNGGGSVRRTILPRSVTVMGDGKALDNEESDTWADVAQVHAAPEALGLTPSWLLNRFGPIPYRLPPSTQLYLESPVNP